MQTETAYRNSPASNSANSNPSTPCRNRSSRVSRTQKLSAGQIARDLKDLCAMGLLETFVDEHRITRYRPTNGRIA